MTCPVWVRGGGVHCGTHFSDARRVSRHVTEPQQSWSASEHRLPMVGDTPPARLPFALQIGGGGGVPSIPPTPRAVDGGGGGRQGRGGGGHPRGRSGVGTVRPAAPSKATGSAGAL